MLDFVIFAVTFLAVLIIAIIWLYPSSKAVTTIPGLSPSTNEDGNLGDIGRAGSLHEFLVDLHSRFGSIAGFWFGQTYMVSIASPELAKEHSSVFDRPKLLFEQFEVLIGSNSIQFANGSEGRMRRRNYDHLFAHDKLPKYSCYFEEFAKNVETKWLEKGKDDHIALSEDCFMYTIRGGLATMFGDDYREEKTFLKYKNTYDFVWTEMENSICKAMKRDKIQQEKFDKAVDFLKSSMKQMVANRKENNLHLQGNLLIDALIEKCQNDATVFDDAITFLIGGFHTTGNLLVWALYFLATHKDVQDKMYQEIKKVLGDDRIVDEYNFSEFVYITQVLDETLRCAVIAPTAARVQDFDSELGGHRVPKNTPVIHALGVMMKDDKLWPLPNKFDPDRFSPENRKKMSTFAFVPFGFAGKRKCPGYRFTYRESVVFLATIIRRFEISLCKDQVVTPVYGLVTHPEDEIWVTVHKRT